MQENCSYLVSVLDGAVKVCTKESLNGCKYAGKAAIKLYQEYRGIYRECKIDEFTKVLFFASILGGNIPLAAILWKKMVLLEHDWAM